MPTQLWICSKCGARHHKLEDAEFCESAHREPTTYRVLSWCDDYQTRAFPKRIRVEMPPILGEHGYATYTLERIGPKGL